VIPEDSPLRRPPAALSRRQVLILDGIRYAADMAYIAYERLSVHLQSVAASPVEPTVRDIAIAMLDAWSIVDSAHRFRDLVAELPGLRNSPWRRLLQNHTDDVADLRNCVQHQLGQVANLISTGGQLWGFLSWAEVRDDHHTGKWHMMAAGSDYMGDQWLFIGPATLPFNVPPGRVRLNAFGRQVYLGRTVEAILSATTSLVAEISSGGLRPVGQPAADRRGADAIYAGGLLVVVSNTRCPAEPSES
jgi:hypothetical protein